MESIEQVMKIRKEYAIRLYEYFNNIKPLFEEQLIGIKEESIIIYKNENNLWLKLQNKKTTLEIFEFEIHNLSQSSGILDNNRLLETNSLREQLQLNLNTIQTEYQKLINITQQKQDTWENQLQKFLLNMANKHKPLTQLKKSVSNTYPELRDHCFSWKIEPMSRLEKIIKDSKYIEDTCFMILKDIKSLLLLNMDQQHLANTKTNQIPKHCEILSKSLEDFMSNLDYLDILEKTKNIDSFVQDFFVIFKDTSFTSLRQSIRMVNNISTTEKKLIIITENFQHIQIIFNQVLDKLLLKKEELLIACTDSDTLLLNICNKWLNTQYQTTFRITEQINQKRNEFVVNNTIV
jgi:hypothetical protein